MQTYQVQIEESVLTPGKYRISNPFGEGTAFYESVRDIEGFAWEGGNTGIIIDATDPSFVYIANDFYSGYNITVQDQPVNPHFYSFVDLNMRFYEIPLDALKQQAPQQFGQLSNGVITFPAAALGFLLSGEYIDDTTTPLYQGNTGDLAIALPGYEITDYSSAFTYRGCFTDVAGNSYAQGTITLGDDVASARYIVAGEGDDLAEIIEGVADGSVEATEITEGGDAGKWTATVRLLGITGNTQTLTATLTYADGNPADTGLESDLTAALADFNADKTVPLTLVGTIAETPAEAGVTATIEDWQPGNDGGEDVNIH